MTGWQAANASMAVSIAISTPTKRPFIVFTPVLMK